MGSRTMPSMCPHGVTVDCGDFGPDPDDGTVGADVCAVCEAAEDEVGRLRQEVRLLRFMVQVYAETLLAEKEQG